MLVPRQHSSDIGVTTSRRFHLTTGDAAPRAAGRWRAEPDQSMIAAYTNCLISLR
jgi:hypothetical protein